MQNGKAPLVNTTQGGSSEPTLKAFVRHALVAILEDPGASAAAKASAGRTLLEYFTDEAETRRRGVDMTAGELNEAIAALER